METPNSEPHKPNRREVFETIGRYGFFSFTSLFVGVAADIGLNDDRLSPWTAGDSVTRRAIRALLAAATGIFFGSAATRALHVMTSDSEATPTKNDQSSRRK